MKIRGLFFSKLDFLFLWFWDSLCSAELNIFNVKTVLFQEIQSSISIEFSSIWPINRTLSGATPPGKGEPGNDGNEGVLRILQSSSITGNSPSDYLVSNPGHAFEGVLPFCREAVGVFYSPNRLGLNVKCNIQDTRWLESYLSAEKQPVYSTVPTDWAWPLSAISRTLVGWSLTSLQRSSRCILQSQPIGPDR